MANTKSAIKAARKAVRLTERNRGVKTRLKTLRKQLDALLAAKDAGARDAASDDPWLHRVQVQHDVRQFGHQLKTNA